MKALSEGQVEIGHSLGLDTLAGINKQKCSTTACIASRDLGTKVNVTRGVHKVKQVVHSLVIVYHRACLRFDCNSALPLDVQLIEDLLVPTGGDGTGEFEEAVAESTFAMIDMGYYTEITKSIKRYFCDPLLELADRSLANCIFRPSSSNGAPYTGLASSLWK